MTVTLDETEQASSSKSIKPVHSEKKIRNKKQSTEETFLDNESSLNEDHDESKEEKSKARSCCCSCDGVIQDFKRTIGKHWVKEMTNINQKTLAVSFFLFFAAIAPAITFGAVYSKVTHNYIGAVEMIAATAWCGIFYSLFGGMPIMINGGTGPVLAFSGVLYKLSNSLNVPFLVFNAWVGLWVACYMIIAAFVDLNRYINYATRFTDEIFALLISMIFIIDALGSPFQPVGLYYYFEKSHASHDIYEDDPDYSYLATGFFSLILGIGTTSVAFFLRGLKFSPFFCNQMVRTSIADFAVTAAILVFTVLDKVFSEVETESLNVPDTFSPSFNCCTAACDTYFPDDCVDQANAYGRRPWVIDLMDLNGKVWVPIIAALPAILAFILVFLDDGITWHLINHPSHKLKHGEACNYDTIIIGFMIGVNSIFGLPWLVAATVRSLNHLHALGNKTPQGKFISVQETRLTSLLVHTLVFASIFALHVIKLIPVPVLYGVFLYMGLVSLGTNQLYHRITMLFMEPSQYPTEPYTQFMNNNKMRLYTVIQLLLFAVLYVVKSVKSIAIAFPIIIAAFIPFRIFILPKIFTKDELILLDGEDDEIEEWKVRNKNGNDIL